MGLVQTLVVCMGKAARSGGWWSGVKELQTLYIKETEERVFFSCHVLL